MGEHRTSDGGVRLCLGHGRLRSDIPWLVDGRDDGGGVLRVMRERVQDLRRLRRGNGV